VFLDYIVDGRSLWGDHRVRPEFHEIPPLGWLSVSADHDAAARLVLEAPPDLGSRTSIFVRASCGDLDCGSISVVIERDGDTSCGAIRRASVGVERVEGDLRSVHLKPGYDRHQGPPPSSSR